MNEMVRKCAMPNCVNKYDPGEETGITFHRIPTVPKIGEEWVNILQQLKVKINSNTRICSAHFQETEFFMAGSVKKLRKYSVPTVNLTEKTKKKAQSCSAPPKKMICWVPDCTHCSLRDNCKFYKFPRDFHNKKKWIRQIRRTDKHPSVRSAVCSCHFLNGLKENGPTIFSRKATKTEWERNMQAVEITKALEHHNYCINHKIPKIKDDDIHMVAPKNMTEHAPCDEKLDDVTLAVEGRYLTANKNILSLFSSYFKGLFETSSCKHPIVFLKDISYDSMNDLLHFMYKGKVQMNQKNFTTFIKTAEYLQISCLANHSNLKQISAENRKKEMKSVDDSASVQQEMVKQQKRKQPSISNFFSQSSMVDPLKSSFLDEKVEYRELPKFGNGLSNKTHEFLTVKVEPVDEEEFGVCTEDPLEYKMIKNEEAECFTLSSEEIIPFKTEPCDRD